MEGYLVGYWKSDIKDWEGTTRNWTNSNQVGFITSTFEGGAGATLPKQTCLKDETAADADLTYDAVLIPTDTDWKNDFVELTNLGPTFTTISGEWKIQLTSISQGDAPKQRHADPETVAPLTWCASPHN